ncbi:hypothetical protein POTG_02077 [Paenibacillus sp. oral taxon 786 str. D14]|uniref:phage scaffolding protein n=1 Tax=Paenibacillus sp. oral taxon 786 TaxID=652715 RepID=UPI0001AFCECA|nr:hypothetical protein [Paenibacillus sp. oral taxon 786]EES73325.1 hypothetical protein POTG_02077 [Paenibacillus sp. oral taxon 786 str. D14]
MSEEALELANKRLVRAEFLIASRNAGVRPEALDAAYKLADLSGVAIDDNGKVWGVDDAIEELRNKSNYLFIPVEKPKPKALGGPSGN